MKITRRIASIAMATVMAVSATAIGTVSVSAATIKAPKNVEAVNSIYGGIKVTWEKSKGAKKYLIYRGGKVVGTVKAGNTKRFVDKTCKPAGVYRFCVKAVDKNGNKSKASNKVIVTRIETEKILSIKNVEDGVKVRVNAAKGADKYLFYRKTTGQFKKLGSSRTPYFIDKTAVSGKKYKYKTFGYASTTKSRSNGYVKSAIALAQPKNVTAHEDLTTYDRIDLSWSKVKGAESYAIYRKNVTEDSYKKVATVKGTSYTDMITDEAVNPTAYNYKVFAKKNKTKSYAGKIVAGYASAPVPGKDRYYYDDNGEFHVSLYLNVGDTYEEGKYLIEGLGLASNYTMEVLEGADLIAVEDGIITAKAAGNARVKITLDDTAYEAIQNTQTGGLGGVLSKVNYLEIEVK